LNQVNNAFDLAFDKMYDVTQEVAEVGSQGVQLVQPTKDEVGVSGKSVCLYAYFF
jgi:hypothetical protein